jgi:hypothetical protein
MWWWLDLCVRGGNQKGGAKASLDSLAEELGSWGRMVFGSGAGERMLERGHVPRIPSS